MAQVDDDNRLARVELGLELLGSDAGDAQVAEEFASRMPFAKDVGCQRSDDQDGEPTAKSFRVFGDGLDLFAKEVAGAEDAETPQQRSHRVEQEEFAGA